MVSQDKYSNFRYLSNLAT